MTDIEKLSLHSLTLLLIHLQNLRYLFLSTFKFIKLYNTSRFYIVKVFDLGVKEPETIPGSIKSFPKKEIDAKLKPTLH